MTMRIATEITTQRIPEQAQREAEAFARFTSPTPSDDCDLSTTEIPMSNILLNGVLTETCIEGALLKAAVQWDKFYVLFMTYDALSDESEMLSIYLLDDRFKLLDSAQLFEPYPVIPDATGSFSGLALIEPNTIHFRFFDFRNYDGTMSVELLPRPGFRIPFLSEPLYVSRPLNFSRHFIVREIRHPLTS